MATKLTARAPAEVRPAHCKGLLFSASGAGKSWFALNFPGLYYLDTEGGANLRHYQDRLAKSGGVYFGQDQGSLDFDTVLGQVQALATEKHQHKTLVIDSITKLYQTAIAKEQERLGERDAFGASKKPAIQSMRRLVNWINRLDMNVWFIAHEVPEWMSVGGQRQEVGRMPDVWDKLVYELDLTLRLEKHNKGLRTATVHKSRLTGFPDGERFNLQLNGEDVGYAEFAQRYGKDFIEAEAVPIVLAKDEQVAEILRLLELIKVPEADVEKILTRASAESWAELTTEQADSTIKWLTGKLAPNAKKAS